MWPKQIKCPRCGGILENVFMESDDASWECPDCRLGACVLNGDIYFDDEDDNYPYDEVYAIY